MPLSGLVLVAALSSVLEYVLVWMLHSSPREAWHPLPNVSWRKSLKTQFPEREAGWEKDGAKSSDVWQRVCLAILIAT